MFRFNWYQNIEIRVILSIHTSPLKLNVRCSMKVNFEGIGIHACYVISGFQILRVC